jgi:bifunctional DNA-binding transcriptional regulator/antitoxin component of YhaV-PrlF toxin-antitoxin module
MNDSTVQLRDKGVLTLPVGLRRKYNLKPGDVFEIVELGDGAFMLSPRPSQLAALGDKVAEVLGQTGLSTEDLLRALDEERERYYIDHYAGQAP